MHKTLFFAVVGLLGWSWGGEVSPFEKTLDKPSAWSRDAKAITCTAAGNGVSEVRHVGTRDWSITGLGRLAVEPGDELTLSAGGAKTADGRAEGIFSPSVILRRADDSVLDWAYGDQRVQAGSDAQVRLLIPPEVVSAEPRIVGRGVFAGRIGPFVVKRVGHRTIGTFAPCTLSNATLRVELDPKDGLFTVTDRRCGRVWRPVMENGSGVSFFLGLKPMVCTAFNVPSATEAVGVYADPFCRTKGLTVRYALEGAELVVRLEPVDAQDPMPNDFRYPQPFETTRGMRLVTPMCEGMSYPVEEEHPNLWTCHLCTGWCASMNFFGLQDGTSGACAMLISETPCDAAFEPRRSAGSKCLTMGALWRPSRRTWGGPRVARLVFLPKGGHVAMAKRYREYARDMGWLKTFKEKAIRRPDVLKLPGALNFWYWDNAVPAAKKGAGRQAMVDELLASGVRHFLWSHGADRALAEKIKAAGGLVGSYDVMQDVYTPEVMEKTGRRGQKGANGDAWPNDVIWNSADSNDWAKAWGLELKGGGMAYTARMCDAKAPQHLRRRLGAQLRANGHNAHFMDVTCSAGPNECWNPAHALNRTESLFWRNELLRMIGDEHGVVVGTENGIGAAVPYFDYGEGIMSLSVYRLPRSGRDVGIPWTNAVPEVCAKYQIGERYRVPLWELVFHDCACAHWYWGDCTDRSVEMWPKRDLFSLLYATAPMFVCRPEEWRAHKDRYLRTYRTIEPVATACGFSEMTNHEVLTDDWSVQRTTFANGVSVTVNFGGKPYKASGGVVVAPGASCVTGLPDDVVYPDPADADAAAVTVDFAAETGPVKPVNGVGQPPMVGSPMNFPMFHYLKEAGIPYSRLHDVKGAFGGGAYADIPNLFPDFDADETDPANYTFEYTDALVNALVKNGVEPYFRLGVTIENAAGYGFRGKRILPPKDFAKWARICEHVIRHYTEGWANGFRHKITYWEIWNEADLNPDASKSMTWQAPFSEYCRLYEVTARHLKTAFPHLKVGGPASCGLYGADNPMARGQIKYHYDCIVEFLDYVKAHDLPLDFFTFHSYTSAAATMKHIAAARKLLDERGLTRCETSLNEWLNPHRHEDLGTVRQASGIAAMLVGMQNSALDTACIYDAKCGVGCYAPFFHPLTYKPHKAYYGFMAFNELRRRGRAVKTASTAKEVWIAAARDAQGASVMVVNNNAAAVRPRFDFGGARVVSAKVVDGTRTWEASAWTGTLPAHSIWSLTLDLPKGSR